MFDVGRLLVRAEAERARREAAGISDGVEARQPKAAPAFTTSLVGKRLEVCWPYKGEDGKTIKIWASGKVKRVADGLTDKRSARAKMVLLPEPEPPTKATRSPGAMESESESKTGTPGREG